MPRAPVNGIELNYREKGEGHPVFLLHGYTGNLRNWALQVATLSNEYRMVSIDHRGHGESDKPQDADGYTLAGMAEDALGVLDHLGIEECYLVGHSMGGAIAQQLALAHPERVRALVLLDTWSEVPRGRGVAERARLLELAETEGMEAVFEEQLRSEPLRLQQLEQHPVFLATWRQQFLMTSPEAYVHCARAIGATPSWRDELRRIGVPALVICGENDEPFIEACRQLHEGIAGSELAWIPNAGHTPQIENAAAFNPVLTGFLSRVQQGVAAGG
jgi:2-succinyl-6-hydroxy-2,4-cyclohexadiene-1-carboxylate synthase